MQCSDESHTAAKHDFQTWITLTYIGKQIIVEAGGDEPEEYLEMRNCTHCDSTLCKLVVVD